MPLRPIGRLLLAAALVIVACPGDARAEVVRIRDWTVASPFGKGKDARTSLSGAACATPTSCLVVNDDKRYAQFVSILGHELVPGPVIGLLPDEVGGEPMKEIDAEAVAFAPGPEGSPSHYYVAGSHGASRSGAIEPSRFFLFRIPVDRGTGLPTFAFDDRNAAGEIARSLSLRAVIRAHPDLAPHAERSPEQGGVTIEGMAVEGETLVLGLRSPAPEGVAFLLRVPLAAAFAPGEPPTTVRRVALEKGAGIRDLAAVTGGFLILSGQSTNRPEAGEPVVSPAIWFWDGTAAEARKLGTLPGAGPRDKAETLVVLGESGGSYRVLVLFDGVENGAPVEFSARR